MIGEFLLDIVFGIVTSIFDAFNLSEIVFNFEYGSSGIFEFIDIVLYFFPVGVCVDIISVIVTFGLFRAVVRLIITIWDLLPIA